MKNAITPYLMFDGNCREALTFYKSVFGGELMLMTYGEVQPGQCPDAIRDRIMHGSIRNGNFAIMASDAHQGGVEKGDTVHLSLDFDSRADLDAVFKKLSEGGEPFMQPQDMFWGAYFAMTEDRFGFRWMLSYDLKKAGAK